VKVVVKHVPDYSASREKNDLGFLTFDLHADLSPLFNWNVKQLFLYLTAEYTTPQNEVNLNLSQVHNPMQKKLINSSIKKQDHSEI
jgi:hypothetical protein